MDLKVLPPISFAQKDPQQIEDELVSRYEKEAKRSLGKADPIYLLIKCIVAVVVGLRANVDFTGKQNLLAFASGDFLLQKVADFNLQKLPAQPAKATIRFTLTQALLTVLNIAKGTRVTPDNRIYFEVPADSQVPIGKTSIDIVCECTTAGDSGNNIDVGHINSIADPMAYLQSAVNLDVSSGGTDEESDDGLRERRLVAPDALSTAGPAKSYEFWARSASKDIIGVSVISPSPGVVRILTIMADGRLPTPAELEHIKQVCSPNDRRPLTDKVETAAPSQVDYDIDLTYWLGSNSSMPVSQLQQSINNAINNYIMYQKTRIGKAIIPETLIEQIMNAGARRVELRKPTHVELSKTQVAKLNHTNIVFGGVEIDNVT